LDVSIALCQLAITGDKAANLDKIAAACDRAAAAGARLAVFPEASMYHFGRQDEPLGPFAETVDGAFATALSRLSRERRIWTLAGMFERIPGDARVYNTLVLFDETGRLAGTYRKIHLYDAFGFGESNRVVAGDGATLQFEVDGVRFGAMTCYDLRFPELARALAGAGAQVLLLPAAWLHGVLKEFHFATLVRARAIENTVYVGAATQCGPGYSANSMLVDPLGSTLAAAAEAEALVLGTISTERIATVRATNPSLHNARPDLYARWLEAGATANRRP
jgi:predicted amidohydrolase